MFEDHNKKCTLFNYALLPLDYLVAIENVCKLDQTNMKNMKLIMKKLDYTHINLKDDKTEPVCMLVNK